MSVSVHLYECVGSKLMCVCERVCVALVAGSDFEYGQLNAVEPQMAKLLFFLFIIVVCLLHALGSKRRG